MFRNIVQTLRMKANLIMLVNRATKEIPSSLTSTTICIITLLFTLSINDLIQRCSQGHQVPRSCKIAMDQIRRFCRYSIPCTNPNDFSKDPSQYDKTSSCPNKLLLPEELLAMALAQQPKILI